LIKEKKELVQDVELLIDEHKARAHQACLLIGVIQMYYTRFKRIIKKVDDVEHGDVFVSYKTNGSVQKIHPGGKNILNSVKGDLLCFVVETRQLGIQVSTRMVRQEASRLLPEFRKKLMEMKNKVISHFMKTMGHSDCSATHTAQKTFKKPKTSLLTSMH
jgi:hypothetical protein